MVQSKHRMIDDNKIKQLAQDVLKIEAEAILKLHRSINQNFVEACKLLLTCKGRIIVTGIGKPGHIAHKIAATLASTGSPAFFMHPSEASHGDIGVITKKDVVIAISNSGNTGEIVAILPVIKLIGVPLISITGNPNSSLAKAAHINLDASVEREAGPLGLAPTTSTTVALALGDAIAIALTEMRDFTAEDFARSHPGGILGKRLLLRVDNLMHTGEAIPKVTTKTSLAEALIEITNKKLGMTIVTDSTGKLAGIFTDGDLRRVIDKALDIHNTEISQVMTTNCKTIPLGVLAVEAIQLMEQYKITSLVAVDNNNNPIGVVHMHTLLQSGLA